MAGIKCPGNGRRGEDAMVSRGMGEERGWEGRGIMGGAGVNGFHGFNGRDGLFG